jgi:hypothetical protein
MSKLKEILEKYQLDETEIASDGEFDNLEDVVIDEEANEFDDFIVDFYESASVEEKKLLDEMLSSDEGYEELLEMIAEAEECDDNEGGEETGKKKDKKKKAGTKVDTKDGDVDESDQDKDKE